MRRLIGPTIAISLLSLLGQIITFAIQIVAASFFGSRSEMDAYLAAVTLPTYFNAVLFGSVSYVLVPLLVDLHARKQDQRAWEAASGVITLYVIVAATLALAGTALAAPLLELTVPGLPASTRDIASGVALIAWPTTLLNGLVLLLTALYHAQERFRLPALAPVIGGLANLVFVSLFARDLGAYGLALAMLASVLAQLALLGGVMRHVSLRLRLDNVDLRHVLALIWPLVVGALFAQAASPLERYVASGLSSGSIPHLGYASRLNAALAALLSGGIAITFFPTLARHSAQNDLTELRKTLSLGMRITWLLVAPTVALGAALAYPLIAAVLQRGAFTAEDTAAVASILPWYLLALIGTTQGNMTARGLYALKRTRLMSLISIVEVALYATLALPLAHRLGVIGVAATMALCANVSFALQSALLSHRLQLGRELVVPFARIAIAAIASAALARWLAELFRSPVVALFVPGAVGVVAYVLVLAILRADELQHVTSALRRHRAAKQ